MNGCGFGGCWWIIILILIFCCGCGGCGNGCGGCGNGCARQVILKSGSVSISGEGLSRPVRLCPDQKFTQNVLQGEFSIEQVDARNYCQWFEERLVFYNMPLTDIMVNLERKYHVEIVLSSSLPANKRLSLVVQHEPLEDIMEVISRLMPVRCQIDGDRVFVTNRGKSR